MDGSSTLSATSTATTSTLSATSSLSSAVPSATPLLPIEDAVPAHHASPVVAFIIGLAIVLLASILNAAGLNLTKLDHVGRLSGFALGAVGRLLTSAHDRLEQVLSQKHPGGKIGCVLCGCWA